MKEIKAVFLNCWLFENKKTGALTLGINYLVNEENSKLDTEKSKGIQVNACFSEKVDAFTKFSKNDAMEPITLIIESVPNPYNVLKDMIRVKAIKTKTTTIEL